MKVMAKYHDGTAPGTTLSQGYKRVVFDAPSFESALEQARLPTREKGKQPPGCFLVWLFVDGELAWTKDGGWVRSPATVE